MGEAEPVPRLVFSAAAQSCPKMARNAGCGLCEHPQQDRCPVTTQRGQNSQGVGPGCYLFLVPFNAV